MLCGSGSKDCRYIYAMATWHMATRMRPFPQPLIPSNLGLAETLLFYRFSQSNESKEDSEELKSRRRAGASTSRHHDRHKQRAWRESRWWNRMHQSTMDAARTSRSSSTHSFFYPFIRDFCIAFNYCAPSIFSLHNEPNSCSLLSSASIDL